MLHDSVFKSIPKGGDVLTIGLEDAVELLKQARPRAGATPLKDLGPHPSDNEPVQVFEGRYGAYVKHGKVNATIPKELSVEAITLTDALALIEARGGARPEEEGRRNPQRRPRRKPPPRKVRRKRVRKKKAEDE